MKNKNIALGGIFTATTVVVLYLSALLPTMRISLIAISSFMITILKIETKGKTAEMLYIASSILAFLLLPIKSIAFLYAVLFGLYSIVKYYIEKLRNVKKEWFLKLFFANIVGILIYLVFRLVMMAEFQYVFYILLVAYNIAFIIFDIAYTKLITIYLIRRKKI